MKNFIISLIITIFCISITHAQSPILKGEKSLQQMDNDLTMVVEKVLPTVVSISAEKGGAVSSDTFTFKMPFGKNPNLFKAKTFGSGVIINKKGIIVTNNHVIENTSNIIVTLYNKKQYKCSVVGVDPATDLAIIKIDEKIDIDLPVITFGEADSIKPGRLVIAIGNSYGFSHTVTLGIISAANREGLGLTDYENLIQTDAAINPGNSGGALVDINGNLLGINTAIYSRSGGNQGLGFAIPSNTVKSIAAQLISNGKVVRGWLGISIQTLTAEIAEKLNLPENTKGVIISDIMKKSPAADAKLKIGDIIIGIDGKDIESINELRKIIADTKPGKSIELKIFRDKENKTVSLVVGKLPDTAKPVVNDDKKDNKLGIAIEEISEKLAFKYNIEDRNGVVIIDIETGSPAEAAGLQIGDVIKQIEGKTVTNVDEFMEIFEKVKTSDSIMLLVKRGNSQLYIVVKIK